MLSKAKTLKGYRLKSLDGEIGRVNEFYFDDRYWTVRYLVADTGDWLPRRQVLLSPYALLAVNKAEQQIEIDLTKKQIEDSPPIERDLPVSLQFEESFYAFYGWPAYWHGQYMWGYSPCIERDRENLRVSTRGEKAWDPHLRSTFAVSDYQIEATDGEIGHVDDFLIDDDTWAIRYLVVATRNWWPGKKVLISPQWIERVSWRDSTVFLNLSRDTIKQSPGYSEEPRMSRDYETDLHQYYSRPGYWAEKDVAVKTT